VYLRGLLLRGGRGKGGGEGKGKERKRGGYEMEGREGFPHLEVWGLITRKSYDYLTM